MEQVLHVETVLCEDPSYPDHDALVKKLRRQHVDIVEENLRKQPCKLNHIHNAMGKKVNLNSHEKRTETGLLVKEASTKHFCEINTL